MCPLFFSFVSKVYFFSLSSMTSRYVALIRRTSGCWKTDDRERSWHICGASVPCPVEESVLLPLGRIRMLASTARGRKTISKIDKQLKAQVKYWDNIGSVDWQQCHQLTRSADIFSLIHPATHPFSTFEYRVSFHERFPHDLLVARLSSLATGCVTRATNPRLRLSSS